MEDLLLDRLREVYAGKSWIVAGEVAQGIAGGALALRSLGADQVICIASRAGVGELPDDVRIVISDDSRVGPNASMIERMHDNNRELHDLPAWVVAEIDEWDPAHVAQVIVSFTIDGGLIADRPTFGARKPEWAALEDKIAIRELWQQAGIATAPDRVVDLADTEALLGAHDELASRFGTVWAVDNDNGWHGGGKGTYWITSRESALAKAGELAVKHRRVRVQPFLEGVPCSIHGMVLRDDTIVFRPCELMVLIDPASEIFEYSRAATFWDPGDTDREEMRSTARAIGDTLRDKVGFRGVFTLDGVLTADGFLPTEVNPRFGAALPPRLPLSTGDVLPMYFMHLAATTGNLDDLDAKEIEDLIVRLLDTHRAGGAFIFTETGPPDGEQLEAAISGTWDDGRVVELRLCEPDAEEEPFATAVWGDDPAGGLIFVGFAAALPTGPPVAPTLVALRAFLADHWDIELAQLQPPFGE